MPKAQYKLMDNQTGEVTSHKSNIHFEIKGHDFVYSGNVTQFEWTHVQSGLGFNGDGTKTKNSILSAVERIDGLKEKGQSGFWEIIEGQPSIEQRIADFKERRELFTHLQNKFPHGYIREDLLSKVVTGKRYLVDVIHLDKKMNTPDGVSLYDLIKEKYGEEIVSIIKKLL